MKKLLRYFTKAEIFLLCFSIFFIVGSFVVFKGTDYMSLTASLIGSAAIVINARGNPAGQFMMIIFSILYGIISYKCSYYGEMVTYMAMTGPMALFSFISWLRNPYNGNKSEVKVNRIKFHEFMFMLLLACIVTVIFYFILRYFNTVNLIPSTISVTTSFIAVYLTFRRSSYFSLAYALNDIILIILWTLAAVKNISYLSVLICFGVFLINDIYAFISWRRMEKRQARQ